MNKYLIPFNLTRGQSGRGTVDHVWRVFENDQEYLFKHVNIQTPVTDEENPKGHWNMVCYGVMEIDRETSTAIITQELNSSNL